MTALQDAHISVLAGHVGAVLGPSGSGKSTLLRLVAGLEPLDAGRVMVAGRDVTRLPAHRRGVGLVFQDHALFPHLDVSANVSFGLVEAGWARPQREARVSELLEDFGLGALANRRVDALSGGERQRVALARALAPRPAVLLLDEPLASLDRGLRERLADDLSQRLRQPDLASVLVTHDLDEAATVADMVLLLRDGRVVQSGTPSALVRDPADAWVARFVGHPNVYEGPERLRLPAAALSATGPSPLVSAAGSSPAATSAADEGSKGSAAWLRDELVRVLPELRRSGLDQEGLDARILRLRPQRGGLRLELHLSAWDVRMVWRGAARELPDNVREGNMLRVLVPDEAWRSLPLASATSEGTAPGAAPSDATAHGAAA